MLKCKPRPFIEATPSSTSHNQQNHAEEAGHAVTSRQKSRVKLAFPEFHACEWLQLGLSCSSGRLLSRCPGIIPVGEPLGRFCVSILSAHVQKSHPFVGVASRAGFTGWLHGLAFRPSAPKTQRRTLGGFAAITKYHLYSTCIQHLSQIRRGVAFEKAT